MKKSFLIPLFFVCTFSLFAQQQERFYAIDGSEWMTEGSRDDRENTLWEELHLNIQYILISGKKPEIEVDMESFMNLLGKLGIMLEKTIIHARNQNRQLGEMFTSEVGQYMLIKEIDLEPCEASDKETFYGKDLRDLYNVFLKAFAFFYDQLKEMADSPTDQISIAVFDADWLNSLAEEINAYTHLFEAKTAAIKKAGISN